MAYTKTNWVNGTTPVNDTNMNKIENALENLDTNISKSTDEYSSTRTYSIGELVIYNNKLYKANQDITTAEAFNSSHWTEVTLLSDVNEIKSVVNKMDEGIANAVEKTGDTMTGELNMQSNSVKFGNDGNIFFKEDGYGDKFRIIPNFNGAGADNKLIIQSTTGEAGTDPQNWKDLVTIHADSGQVDLIHPAAWTDATKTSAIEGTVKYTKIGNIVIVIFDDLLLKSNISHGTILVSGLPASTSYQRTVLDNYDLPDKPIRVAINESGQIITHYPTRERSTGNYYGTLIYMTN